MSEVSKFKSYGFTLVELMITVLIVGILAAISYPSYVNYNQNSRKSAAAACLVEMAQFMERHYTANNSSYVGAVLPAGGCRTASNLNNFYTISIAADPALTASTFLLEAVPVVGSSQVGQPCGTLALNHQGVRLPLLQGCW